MQAIIFDMDGTMVDNMMIHHQAWQEILIENGVHLSIEEVKARIHGVNVELLQREFGDQFTLDQRISISAEKERRYRAIFKDQMALLPGLELLLDELIRAEIPLAIGTAAPPENVNFVLDNLSIRDYFTAVFHSDDVKRGKPDPEIFQLAADALQVPLEDCLIFEDSVTGAEAARNAGSKAIIVTTTHDESEFRSFDHILHFISDYREVTLDFLRNNIR